MNQLLLHQAPFPKRSCMSGLEDIFQKLWTIADLKQCFQPNQLVNAVVKGDKKVDWAKNWKCSPAFTLASLVFALTFSVFAFWFGSQVILMNKILENDYILIFILTINTQCDSLRRGFTIKTGEWLPISS